MHDDAVLDLDTRRRIFAHVVDHPGTYLRELQRALDMPMGMLEYHLDRLEKARLVSVVHGDNKRFFPERMDAADKRYLALLRQEACRHVVVHLLARGTATHKDILAACGLASSTLSYYLAKLVEAGLATRAKEGRTNRYALVDRERAHALLVRHRPTFLDRILDRFLESFDGVRLADAGE